MIQSRSPSFFSGGAFNGGIGAVNMGTGSDDRPFLPFSIGLNSTVTGSQYPNGMSVTQDTLFRLAQAVRREHSVAVVREYR